MNQDMTLKATPSVARRILRLADVNSKVVVDDALIDIARQGEVSEEALAEYPLTDQGRELVQELIDLDLRAGVAMFEKSDWIDNDDWIIAVCAAAKLYGLEHIFILNEQGKGKTGRVYQRTRQYFGEQAHHITSPLRTLTDEQAKIRSKSLLLYIEQQTFVPTMPPVSAEFFHTVVVGPPRVVHALHIFPNMPNLSSVLGESTAGLMGRGFNPAAKKVAFLFNIAVAMNRRPE